MDLLSVWLERLNLMLPVFLRVGGFIAALPMMGRSVPVMVKVGLAGILTLFVFPGLGQGSSPSPSLLSWVVILLSETLVGLALGFLVAVFFSAVVVAGQLIDVPMGFGMANVIDPQSGAPMPVAAQFQNIITILVFCVLDGHHTLLRLLTDSFNVVPIGEASWSSAGLEAVLQAVADAFVMGIKLGLPVLAGLLLTDVALGIMSRAVPQINLFAVGFSIKIGVGLLLLMFAVPGFLWVLTWAFAPAGELSQSLSALLRGLRR